jgi:hypothetical protein
MSRTPRPTRLAVGIVLASLRALILLGVLVLVGGGGLVMMIASAGERGDDAVAMLVFGALIALASAGVFALELLILAICCGAWCGWRVCVWALLGLSVLGIGLPSPGPFKTPIAIVTLIGCIQALERRPGPLGDAGDSGD